MGMGADLTDDIDQLLHGTRMSSMLGDDDSSGPVAEDVRACRLDDIQVLGVIGQEVEEEIPSLGVIEIEVEAPMQKPHPLLERL